MLECSRGVAVHSAARQGAQLGCRVKEWSGLAVLCGGEGLGAGGCSSCGHVSARPPVRAGPGAQAQYAGALRAQGFCGALGAQGFCGALGAQGFCGALGPWCMGLELRMLLLCGQSCFHRFAGLPAGACPSVQLQRPGALGGGRWSQGRGLGDRMRLLAAGPHPPGAGGGRPWQ